MASGNTDFSHIVVHADDDDDIVIYAGACSEHLDTESFKPAGNFVSVSALNENGWDDSIERTHSQEKSEIFETAVDNLHEDERYRETDTEDLGVGSMPVVQKITIVWAFIVVAASVIYYVVCMR